MHCTTDWFAASKGWYLVAAFDLNTDLLETNLINLAIVIGVLIYYGRGVLTARLQDREQSISSTLRDAQEQYQRSLEQSKRALELLSEAKALVTQAKREIV